MINGINPERLCMGCMASIEDNTAPCPHCGWLDSNDERSPHQLPTQTILNGKYLVGRVLGEGGFGITYLGWDLNLDMKVAIKEYYPSGFVSRETTFTTTVTPFAGDKREAYLGGLTRFVGEAKSLAKFYSLPGVVSVKDFFKENGTAYIVMEYVDGITLKQYLKEQGGKLLASTVFDMVKPLMKSLGQMHAANIIHRDISPDNIMITREGNIKLLDFGAARSISTDGAKSLSVLLKPGYAPEEQYRSRGSQGPWTDIYALSATLYKMITGETPPESMERMHEDILVPPSKLGVCLNEAQENALLKGLAILQKDRYQSIEDFYGALFSLPHDTTDFIGATMAIPKDKQNTGYEPKRQDISHARPSERPLNVKADTNEAETPRKAIKKFGLTKVLITCAILVVAVVIAFVMLKGPGENVQGQRDIPESDSTAEASNPVSTDQPGKSNEPGGPMGGDAPSSMQPSETPLSATETPPSATETPPSATTTPPSATTTPLSETPISGQNSGVYPDHYLSLDFHSTNKKVWKDCFYYSNYGSLMKFSVDLEESLPNEVYYQLSGGPSNVSVDLSEVITGPVDAFIICKHPETGKDVIFFSRNDASGGSICIANLDGSGERTLYRGESVGYMAIDQGWLYFNDYSDCKISRMRLDGSSQETVLNLGKDWSWCAITCVYDGWIHFVGLNPDWAPYRVRINGQDFEKVTSNIATAFSANGYLYYYEDGLTRSRLDGSDKKQIIPEYNGIHVSAGWIYYSDDNGVVFKSRLDGSDNEILPYSFTSTDPTFVFHPTSDGRFMYFYYEPMGPGWYRIED